MEKETKVVLEAELFKATTQMLEAHLMYELRQHARNELLKAVTAAS